MLIPCCESDSLNVFAHDSGRDLDLDHDLDRDHDPDHDLDHDPDPDHVLVPVLVLDHDPDHDPDLDQFVLLNEEFKIMLKHHQPQRG